MFLQDFDLLFLHILGSAMGPADALSHLPDPDTSSDNTNITLLPDNLFIHTIDIALLDKITSSSPSDLLVLNALHNISASSPLFPHSSVANWHFADSKLYFKGHIYIPPTAHHDLVSLFILRSPPATGAFSTLILCCPMSTGGPVCPPLSAVSLWGVLFASR